jgi:hypothetical protein
VSGIGGGNVPWPAFKGVIKGSEDLARTVTHFAVDRRYENGTYWIELGVFPSRFLAREALDAHAAQTDDDVDAASYRIRKVEPHG